MISATTLFDTVINLTLHYEDAANDIRIECPSAGPKPHITFSYSRVPGNFCYSCTIRVYNLYLRLNAAQVKSITITAGYGSSVSNASNIKSRQTATFDCSVFASYPAEANPDGCVVFECLVASATSNLLDTKPYDLTYLLKPEPKSVEYVLKEATSAEHLNLKLNLKGVSSKVLETAFSTKPIRKQGFRNGYQLINYFQNRLNELVREDKHSISAIIYNDSLSFVEYDEKGALAKVKADVQQYKADIVYLDLVTEVDWNAGVLNIIAPWVPKVTPGTIIRITPSVYKGSVALPNEVVLQQLHKDPDDYYYVLTQSVEFSTYDDANKMSIMAVPFKNSPDAAAQDKSAAELNDAAVLKLASSIEELRMQALDKIRSHIRIGEEDPDETVKTIDDLSVTLPAVQSVSVNDLNAYSLEQVAIAQGYPMLKGSVQAQQYSIEGKFPGMCLIMILTNEAAKKNPSQYFIDMSNPDLIRRDYSLMIPSAAEINWKSLQQTRKDELVKIFSVCSEFYRKKQQAEYARCFSLAKILFEQGVVE